MGYSIRYTDAGIRRIGPAGAGKWRMKLIAWAVLLTAVFLKPELVGRYLAHQPRTVWEQAVWNLSAALKTGEGWYCGLLVWCRTVLSV